MSFLSKLLSDFFLHFAMKLFCTGLLLIFGPPLVSIAEESTTQPADSPNLWVSSIAPIGDGQYAVGLANGLLLRPSKVIQIDEDAIGDVSKQAAARTLYEHKASVWCVAATSDQKHLASLDYRGNLATMDVASGKFQIHDRAGERWCQCLAASPDDRAWVFGNESGKLLVWSIEKSKQTDSIDVGDEPLTSLSFSPSGKWLALGSGAGQLRVFSWPELKQQHKVAVGEGPVWSVLFYGDDSIIAGSNDRQVYSIRCDQSGKLDAPSVLLKAGDWVTKLLRSGGDVYAGEVSGKVHRMRLGGSDPMEAPSGVWALAVTDHGSVIAGTRRDGVTNLTAVAAPVEPVVANVLSRSDGVSESEKSRKEGSKIDESTQEDGKDK